MKISRRFLGQKRPRHVLQLRLRQKIAPKSVPHLQHMIIFPHTTNHIIDLICGVGFAVTVIFLKLANVTG